MKVHQFGDWIIELCETYTHIMYPFRTASQSEPVNFIFHIPMKLEQAKDIISFYYQGVELGKDLGKRDTQKKLQQALGL
jgi:hypothetical protein